MNRFLPTILIFERNQRLVPAMPENLFTRSAISQRYQSSHSGWRSGVTQRQHLVALNQFRKKEGFNCLGGCLCYIVLVRAYDAWM